MTVTAAWTAPTSLDRTVGQNLPSATYEEVLGDILYLYDVLTAALSLAVHLTSSLTVDGAVSAGSLTVAGAALRRTTYGTLYIANPGLAAGGGINYVTVDLADAVTPVAVSVAIDTVGTSMNLVGYAYSPFSSGSVTVTLVNWGASAITSAITVHVIADY